jgi:hypothetical protein
MCSPDRRSGRGRRPPSWAEVGPIPGSAWPGGETGGMAFGQQAGPPASRREVQELLTLLQDAGYTDFRDARGPMGFTQRQAAGKFTRDEAAAFIAQLQETESSGEPAAQSGRQSPPRVCSHGTSHGGRRGRRAQRPKARPVRRPRSGGHELFDEGRAHRHLHGREPGWRSRCTWSPMARTQRPRNRGDLPLAHRDRSPWGPPSSAHRRRRHRRWRDASPGSATSAYQKTGSPAQPSAPSAQIALLPLAAARSSAIDRARSTNRRAHRPRSGAP